MILINNTLLCFTTLSDIPLYHDGYYPIGAWISVYTGPLMVETWWCTQWVCSWISLCISHCAPNLFSFFFSLCIMLNGEGVELGGACTIEWWKSLNNCAGHDSTVKIFAYEQRDADAQGGPLPQILQGSGMELARGIYFLRGIYFVCVGVGVCFRPQRSKDFENLHVIDFFCFFVSTI